MSIGDPDFAGHLKNAWDQHFSQHDQLTLVLCGSVSSWIQDNILNNTGFVGRIAWEFFLEPLPLHDCNAFWDEYETRKKTAIPSKEKLQILAITGGVPKYLEDIDQTQSAQQNIQRLCFNPRGPLFNECEKIFHDIFSRRSSSCRDIVSALVDGPHTLKQISESLGRESGGSLTRSLRDLTGAGFICEDCSFSPVTAKPMNRTTRYRLSDNYLRFYLKYVEPHRLQIEKGIYQDVPLSSLEAWDTIIGLQFDNLIYNSRHKLLSLLNLKQTSVLNVGPFFQNKTQRKKACQIDLLI